MRIDSAMIERARKIADERCRLPHQTPIAAAIIAGMLTLFGLVVYDSLVRNFGFDAATVIGVLVIAGLTFLDCNQKWSIHTRAFRDALTRLESEQPADVD